MKKLKVGIAGYGVVGQRRRSCIESHPAMRLAAVCDRTFEGSGQFDDGVLFYQDYKQLIEQELDVLIVCLSNDIAAEVSIAGLERGLHVFCEKPPGKNVDDIANVIRCEREHPGLKLMYGFNHRFHESVQDATRLIQSGELGKILNMRGVYGKSQLITFNQTDWRTQRDIAGGGVLLDQGIHMVDLMRLFAGEFIEVHSFISNSHWGYDVEDNAYALMKTQTGVVAMLNSSATQWRHRFHLDINLEKGSLILGGILSGSKSYGSETLTVVTIDPDNNNGDPREQQTRYNHDPSWNEEINIFADCILNDRPVENCSSMDAYNTMKLVYQIYHADPVWRKKYSIPDPGECVI
ncbi:MAG: Gfo/Idh/MocA family oxidoreductase [Desulfamplus sp.]|nr:Gfo/Idh/MocA family oxidoreductase [Desulfamplus sp.]